MPLTNELQPVALYLEGLLITNAASLGIANLTDGTPSIFYGDQNRIPVTPTVCVDPGEKRRELNGSPRRTLITIVNYILVYHNRVDDVTVVSKEGDALSEDIETVIHVDAKMGGLVIDSMVAAIEFGYQTRGKTLYRVSRLTVEGRSQVQLPSSV